MKSCVKKKIEQQTCVISLHDPSYLISHHKSSEAVCPCVHSNLCFKGESWVNDIVRVCHLILPLCPRLIYYFYLILEFLYTVHASSPRMISSMSYPPFSQCARLSSSFLWHNPVKARDLIWWNDFRTYDERDTDIRQWQRYRLGYGTSGLPCQLFKGILHRDDWIIWQH